MTWQRRIRRPCGQLLAILLLICSLDAPSRAHSPHDVVDALAVSPAYGRDGTVFGAFTLTNRRVFARSFDGGRSWLEVAPPMAIRVIKDIAFSPAYATDGTVFIGTATGGVYRSTDGGTSWISVGDTPSVQDVAVSPDFAEDGTVLAATRTAVWVSHDGGETWFTDGTGLTDVSHDVAGISPDGATLYVGGKNLHRSLDGGMSWTPLQLFPDRLASLAVSPLDPSGQTLALGFGMAGGGVLVSTDGGATFGAHMDGLGDLRVNAVAFAGDGTLFAATAEGGLFRSAPGLLPWTVGTGGLEELSELTDNHYTLVSPSPDFAIDDTVFLGGFEGLFTSADRGDTWVQQEIYTQRVNRLLALSPGWAADRTLFTGNYGGGMYAFSPAPQPAAPAGAALGAPVAGQSALTGDTDALAPPGPGGSPQPGPGTAWRALSTGTGTFSSVLGLSPGYPADRTLYYGYSGLFRSQDDGASWQQLPKPPVIVLRGLCISPDFANDGIAMLGSSEEGAWRSDDGIQSWVEMTDLPHELRTSRIVAAPDFAASGRAFLASDQGVWRTDDKGLSWSPTPLDENVRALEVSPGFASDGVIFAGTVGRGLFVSDDAGFSWQPVTAGLPPLPGVVVEDVALSPAFATDGTAFLCTLGEGVFRSEDGGSTWSPADDGLPPDAARQIEVSPDFADDGTVVTTNHDWVHISTDAGDSWSRLPGFVRVDDRHQSARYEGPWDLFADSTGEAQAEDCDLHRPPAAGRRGPAPVSPALPPGALSSVDFGKGTALSGTAGDSTSLSFFGDSITWIGVRGPTSGRVTVAVDDVTLATVDLYAPASQHQQRLFTRHFPELGWHTIRVTNTGTASPSSSGIHVRSDGFEYTF